MPHPAADTAAASDAEKPQSEPVFQFVAITAIAPVADAGYINAPELLPAATTTLISMIKSKLDSAGKDSPFLI